jgi:branched-chain amino acid transport system substrate-binding protein
MRRSRKLEEARRARLLSRRDFLRISGMGAVGGLVLAACRGGGEEPVVGDEAAGAVAVGSILDQTGPINIYGLPMIDATNFAIDTINEQGGVLGRRLNLQFFDGQSTNEAYTQFATQLALDDDVPVIMGGITSASREAVRPIVEQNEKLYFYNEQYEGGVCSKFVFNTGVVPSQQLRTLIPWAIQNIGPKFYTAAADYNYGQISADWVRRILEEEGGELVGEEFIPLEVAEFGPTIDKVQRAKPDVFMSLLVGGNHIAFYRQFAAAGLGSQIQVVSPTLGLGNEQVVLDPSEAQGIIVVYPYFQELDNPTNQEFVSRWHERFGEDYAYITDSANVVWIGWHLWAMAVEQAGTFETGPVIEALERGLEFDAPEGRVSLDGPSHHLWHNAHIAEVNDQNGFDIIETFESIPPEFEQEVCNLIENPETREQFQP